MGQKVVVIVGPTASGKSALAVSVAKKIGGEIISADSRQVYKKLDLGTGKISKEEMRGVPHHMLDVAPARRRFTAQDFTKSARKIIADISKRDKIPIVVGGTGFYIDALLGNIELPEVAPNNALRARLSKKSPDQLFRMLKKIDPKRAKTIDGHNSRRTIRAIEIALALGKNPAPRKRALYDTKILGISIPAHALNKRIDKRLNERIKKGMVLEAKRLKKSGLSYKRMEELGLEYRSLSRLLQNKITHPEFVNELSSDIKRYAKKQMSYWRRNKNIVWRSPAEILRMHKANSPR